MLADRLLPIRATSRLLGGAAPAPRTPRRCGRVLAKWSTSSPSIDMRCVLSGHCCAIRSEGQYWHDVSLCQRYGHTCATGAMTVIMSSQRRARLDPGHQLEDHELEDHIWPRCILPAIAYARRLIRPRRLFDVGEYWSSTMFPTLLKDSNSYLLDMCPAFLASSRESSMARCSYHLQMRPRNAAPFLASMSNVRRVGTVWTSSAATQGSISGSLALQHIRLTICVLI